MKARTFRLSRWLLIALLLGVLAGFALAFWAKTQSDNPEEVTTSVAAPKPAPPREVQNTTIDATGNLIITYSDGSVSNVGKVVGAEGQPGEGLYPTTEQLDGAIERYCADGRCDADNPTEAQVLRAVAFYCSGGTCRGDRGMQGPAPTAQQLEAAVAAYCADGRCRGETGATGTTGATGAQGVAGKSPEMACVIRTTNNTSTRYVAWKYAGEPDTEYRNIYQLPVWAVGENCVDLRGEQ
jgi:hypothetical protein